MDVTAINPLALPSLSLNERAALPDEPAIYFALADNGTVLYIGKARRLAERWKSTQHHRYAQLFETGNIRLAWLSVSDEKLLPVIEAGCIRRFSPALNRSAWYPSVTGTIKRTHTFDQKLLERLERAAKQERRAVSEQLSIFLEEALARFEKNQTKKQESESGNRAPALLAVA